jgi:hypothetical protein
VKILFPTAGVSNLQDVIDLALSRRFTIRPFDDLIVDFLDSLSKSLFTQAREEPSLAPLAFFMRRAATKRLEATHTAGLPNQMISVPQGLVFHVPPTNVDTLFLYSLTISLLTGNSNIVRISENSGPATFRVLGLLFDELSKNPRIADLVTVIQFGREHETLQSLSRSCDVRMIWGGDASIASIRRAELSPGAKDLTFPDRVSFSAVGAEAWLSAKEATRSKLIEAFYNDTFWFDQMACSSPQLLVFVSPSIDLSQSAETDFLNRLNLFAQEKYEIAEGVAINKMVAAVNGVARGATRIEWASNFSVFLDGLDLEAAEEIRPGGGFLSTQWVEKLDDLTPAITRRTQTLSVFGISDAKISSFLTRLNGRGIDRVVPFGAALDFEVVWDGKNLVAEMMRLVTVRS